MDHDVARGRLMAARVGHLATIGATGPHVVPCCFAVSGGLVVTAVDDVKPKSTNALRRLDNIAHEQRASLLVDHYDEDWAALWWVRVDGTATVAAESAFGRRLLEVKYDQYRRSPPPGPYILLAVDTWRSWEASGGAR